jgi:membrane-associated HD superfamily phosphohydrolase
LTAGSALADGTIEQKTRVQFGGMIGGIVNVFGGKAAREGVTSTTAVDGNRRLTTTGRTGELVDLDAEKVYTIDYDRKTYRVKTFDQMRKEYEEARKEAAENEEERKSDKDAAKAPEYEVDVAVKETGAKETINGFATKEVVTTITVREKGKKLEQSGGAVLTADMWMGPKIGVSRELAAFNAKFFRAVYGDALAEMQQMAVLMATSPAFAKAMKEFAKKQTSFEGEPIRTNMTVETVAAAGQAQEAEQEDQSVVGGLLARAMKKRQEKKGEPASAPGRTKLFDSTTEVLHAENTATGVELPAGFKQK